MQAIVELEGILFNVQAAYWEAYSRAVGDIGWARTDEMTFWRLIRTGAEDGEFVRGARPHQVAAFRKAFDAHLESDACVARFRPHDDIRERLRVLRDLGRRHAVSAGTNATAREELLTQHQFKEAIPDLTLATSPAAVGAGVLLKLAGGEVLTVVLASTEALAKTADAAGLVTIGITSGPCIAKRLSAAGAVATYKNLTDFAAALRIGDEALRRAGLCM